MGAKIKSKYLQKMINHFIITRFNLRMKEWSLTKNNQTILDDEWHMHRFELFEKYCLPSVSNQTCKDFKWLIFFDITTPSKFKERIDDLVKKTGAFQPVFINGGEVLLTSLRQVINKMDLDHNSILITSRLDNDDLLYKNFVDTIQSMANYSKKQLVDARYGYRMNAEKRVIHIKKKFGPFLSLIEPIEDFQTIFFTGHGQWKELSKGILKTIDKPMWMQIIHDKNIANSFPFFARRAKYLDLSTFGI